MDLLVHHCRCVGVGLLDHRLGDLGVIVFGGDLDGGLMDLIVHELHQVLEKSDLSCAFETVFEELAAFINHEPYQFLV